jgi:hypothetical protein
MIALPIRDLWQMSLRLDTSRNELLVANAAFTIILALTAFGSYIGGIFGMNLDNVTHIMVSN